MPNRYVIVNSAGRKLSGHYPGAYVSNLVFRKNDWYSFSTRKEAEEFLQSILRHGYGKNLRIVSR